MIVVFATVTFYFCLCLCSKEGAQLDGIVVLYTLQENNLAYIVWSLFFKETDLSLARHTRCMEMIEMFSRFPLLLKGWRLIVPCFMGDIRIFRELKRSRSEVWPFVKFYVQQSLWGKTFFNYLLRLILLDYAFMFVRINL